MTGSQSLFGSFASDLTAVSALEGAAATIALLGGRISVTPVRHAWERRATWTGYARALQLQGREIDEIDVFCWGCDVRLPDRKQRPTNVDDFDEFASWVTSLRSGDNGGWKDALPFSAQLRPDAPRILQALDLQRQFAQKSPGIAAWLALPIFIYRLGASPVPLANLVAGSKAFGFAGSPSRDIVHSALRSLRSVAHAGLATLDEMEKAYARAIVAIHSEYRPGKLPALLALSLSVAALSPTTVAERLELSLAGAGKLLDRAASLGLIVEISGRQTWKRYLSPDLAVALGFRRPPLGRPRKEPIVSPDNPVLAEVLGNFDRELADIEARLGALTTSTTPGNAKTDRS